MAGSVNASTWAMHRPCLDDPWFRREIRADGHVGQQTELGQEQRTGALRADDLARRADCSCPYHVPVTSILADLKQALDLLVGAPEFYGEEPEPAEKLVFDEAVRNFRAAGPELLNEATPYLWAYYRSTAEEFDLQQRAEYGIPELGDGAEIWDEVTVTSPPTIRLGGSRLAPGTSYLSFEGEVTWEPEHGLQLVFEHGLRVCKVGPYDGHDTVAHAFDDETLLGEVYR